MAYMIQVGDTVTGEITTVALKLLDLRDVVITNPVPGEILHAHAGDFSSSVILTPDSVSGLVAGETLNIEDTSGTIVSFVTDASVALESPVYDPVSGTMKIGISNVGNATEFGQAVFHAIKKAEDDALFQVNALYYNLSPREIHLHQAVGGISGDTAVTGTLLSSGNILIGGSTSGGFTGGSLVVWKNGPCCDLETVTGGTMHEDAGNVGVGEPSPAEKLDVNGAIKVGNTATANAGTIRYTGTDLEVYHSGGWNSLTTSSGSGISNLIEDTTPELGGQLVAGSNKIAFDTGDSSSELCFQHTWDASASAEVNHSYLASVKSIDFYLDMNGGDTGQAIRVYNNLNPTSHNPDDTNYIWKLAENGTMYMTGNIVTGSNNITDGKVSNWDTAYGWGDHGSAGYLTSETTHADVLVDGDFSSTGLMKRGAVGGSYSVVTDNSTNWDTAYSWGDHSTAGYSTSGASFGGGVIDISTFSSSDVLSAKSGQEWRIIKSTGVTRDIEIYGTDSWSDGSYIVFHNSTDAAQDIVSYNHQDGSGGAGSGVESNIRTVSATGTTNNVNTFTILSGTTLRFLVIDDSGSKYFLVVNS